MTVDQIDHNTFTTTARGTTMTLLRTRTGWEMMSSNASTRAWSRGPSIKHFETLENVEANYRSWQGITRLVSDHTSERRNPS
jgi:hypothetical protein